MNSDHWGWWQDLHLPGHIVGLASNAVSQPGPHKETALKEKNHESQPVCDSIDETSRSGMRVDS